MEQQLTDCPNCEKPYDVEYNFCPHCGQKTDEKITIKNLFYNTITNYFSFDARFFKSFIPLLFRPGYLPKKFVEGKRLLYLHPAQMYLFISVIFFFLFSFIQRDQESEINKALSDNGKAKLLSMEDSIQSKKDSTISVDFDSIKGEVLMKAEREKKVIDSFSNDISQNSDKYGLNKEQGAKLGSLIEKGASKRNINSGFNFNEDEIDSLIQSGASDKEIYQFMGMADDAGFLTRKFYGQILKFYKNRDGGSILRTFYDAIPVAMFFLLPIFALLVYLLYIGKGRFAHHLVFSFYYFSFLFAIFAILVGINLFYDIPDWIDWMIVCSTFFYLYLALKKYYEQGWVVTFIKSGFLSFLFLMIVLPLAGGLVLTYALLFY